LIDHGSRGETGASTYIIDDQAIPIALLLLSSLADCSLARKGSRGDVIDQFKESSFQNKQGALNEWAMNHFVLNRQICQSGSSR
jgi:hypothetical protein